MQLYLHIINIQYSIPVVHRSVLTSVYENLDSPTVVDENNPAKRLYPSNGDTPGKPERNSSRRSHNFIGMKI